MYSDDISIVLQHLTQVTQLHRCDPLWPKYKYDLINAHDPVMVPEEAW